jgi:thioredoxin-dependent peroxiredoxin
MFGLFNLLPIGSPAPLFALPNQNNNVVSLQAMQGKPVVLVFYPANFTPGCTSQLCSFRDDIADLTQAGFVVLGINPAKQASHKRFADAHQLPFDLLSDAGMAVSKQYKAVLIPGVVQNRVVYGLDAQGIIRFAQLGDPKPAAVQKAVLG